MLTELKTLRKAIPCIKLKRQYPKQMVMAGIRLTKLQGKTMFNMF